MRLLDMLAKLDDSTILSDGGTDWTADNLIDAIRDGMDDAAECRVGCADDIENQHNPEVVRDGNAIRPINADGYLGKTLYTIKA